MARNGKGKKQAFMRAYHMLYTQPPSKPGAVTPNKDEEVEALGWKRHYTQFPTLCTKVG